MSPELGKPYKIASFCEVLAHQILSQILLLISLIAVSSQIEGTQSTLDDLLRYEADQTQGISVADASEVSSYVAALNHGLERIKV